MKLLNNLDAKGGIVCPVYSSGVGPNVHNVGVPVHVRGRYSGVVEVADEQCLFNDVMQWIEIFDEYLCLSTLRNVGTNFKANVGTNVTLYVGTNKHKLESN